jgi:selenocysteine lyase/cysteine desulfurase
MSTARHRQPGLSRRDFARLVGFGASIPWLAQSDFAFAQAAPLPQTAPAAPTEAFWQQVRDQFVMPKDLGVLNAANLCPSSGPVLQAMYDATKDMDQDPSPDNRAKLTDAKEKTRKILADFLRVTPDEIVITRNTSEANNTVSTGIDLKAGDEVIVFQDNHPSNKGAWEEKAKRWGFTVKVLPNPNPHPGAEYYIEAVTKAITPRTKVLAFTHHSSSVGDILPAKEFCRIARERGVLSLMDGAQTFGLFDVDLSDIQPDFFTGSAHKWPCGPKETGVLYVNKAALPKLWASIISAYRGPSGASAKIEAYGQRDEPAIIAFGESLTLQTRIGRKNIEKRSQELAQALMKGLRAIDGVKVWTSPDPSRSHAVVSFLPGNLDIRKLSAALYQKDRLAFATRGGADRGGLRASPHFYNTHAEIDRTVAAIKRYMSSGLTTSAA